MLRRAVCVANDHPVNFIDPTGHYAVEFDEEIDGGVTPGDSGGAGQGSSGSSTTSGGGSSKENSNGIGTASTTFDMIEAWQTILDRLGMLEDFDAWNISESVVTGTESIIELNGYFKMIKSEKYKLTGNLVNYGLLEYYKSNGIDYSGYACISYPMSGITADDEFRNTAYNFYKQTMYGIDPWGVEDLKGLTWEDMADNSKGLTKPSAAQERMMNAMLSSSIPNRYEYKAIWFPSAKQAIRQIEVLYSPFPVDLVD